LNKNQPRGVEVQEFYSEAFPSACAHVKVDVKSLYYQKWLLLVCDSADYSDYDFLSVSSQDAVAVRERWLSLAKDPSAVEWLFAVDADDSASIAHLGRVDMPRTKVTIVPVGSLYQPGASCVSGKTVCTLARPVQFRV